MTTPEDTAGVPPADDPQPRPPITPDAAQGAFRQALRFLVWLVGGLAVVGGVVGYLVSGWGGLASAMVGVALALFFSGTTVVSVQRAGHEPARMIMVIMGAWMVKMVVVFVVLAVLSHMGWVQPLVLGLVLAAGVVGSALLDYRAVSTARMPYVGQWDEGHTPPG